MNPLTKTLEGIGSPTILVVGDLMLDRYVWGDVERISPEAPIPILKITSEEMRLGGAGNVANNLFSLGACPSCCGIIGSDFEGKSFKDLLQEIEVDTSGIIEDSARPTTVKTRMLAHSQQMIRFDKELTGPIPEDLQEKVIEYLKDRIAQVDLVLLSDYDKGMLTEKIVSAVISEARKHNIKTLVDPKSRDYSKYRGATVITPNQHEAIFVTGIDIDGEKQLQKVGQKLLKDFDLEAVVITRGAEGISLFHSDGQQVHIPAKAKAVYDVTGAGDTVLSLLGLVLAGGHSYVEAVEIANVAGGVAVGKIGTAPVTREEIISSLHE